MDSTSNAQDLATQIDDLLIQILTNRQSYRHCNLQVFLLDRRSESWLSSYSSKSTAILWRKSLKFADSGAHKIFSKLSFLNFCDWRNCFWSYDSCTRNTAKNIAAINNIILIDVWLMSFALWTFLFWPSKTCKEKTDWSRQECWYDVISVSAQIK